jgi:hypothetical protein
VIEAGYGAGTDMLWNEWSWEPAPEITDPAEALAKGNLLSEQIHASRLPGDLLYSPACAATKSTKAWMRGMRCRPGAVSAQTGTSSEA